MLRKAGADFKPVVFLFSDTQIKDESFLEDINNILNSGEVPNMFPQDERMQVRGGEGYARRHVSRQAFQGTALQTCPRCSLHAPVFATSRWHTRAACKRPAELALEAGTGTHRALRHAPVCCMTDYGGCAAAGCQA